MRILTILFLWIISGLGQMILAAERGVSVPAEDISLTDAQQSFNSVRASSSNAHCPQHTYQHIDAFDFGIVGGTCDAMRTAVNDNICGSLQTLGGVGEYYWAPVDQFEDGSPALGFLESRAKDGKAFVGRVIYLAAPEDPEDPAERGLALGTSVIVHSTHSTRSEQHLALCAVAVVSTTIGPPHDCVTVAIVTPTATWMRGGHLRHQCPSSWTLRSTGAIDIAFDVIVTTHTNVQVFSDAVGKMMKADLDLATEQTIVRSDGKVRGVVIRSAAGLRNSTILPKGWREALDFDVDLFTDGDDVSVHGAAHVMVARQALGDVDQYQGLNDAQRDRFANVLNSRVNEALKAPCKSVIQKDSKTLTCN